MSKGGGGSSGSQYVTTQSNPPAYAAPYLNDIAQKSQAAYNQVSKSPYSGQLVAAPTANQLVGQSAAAGLSANPIQLGQNLQAPYQASSQIGQNQLNNNTLFAPINTKVDTAPIDTAALTEAAVNPLRQQLQQQILPQANSQAIAAGAYGGTGQQNLDDQAINSFNQATTNIAGTNAYNAAALSKQMGLQNVESQRQAMPGTALAEQNLMQLTPQLQSQGYQASLQPANTLNQVGSTQQAQNQDQLNQAYQQWLNQQAAPFQGLPEYSQLINNATMGGTTSQQGGGSGSNLFGNVLSGALGGNMLSNTLFGQGLFTGGASGLGLLGGLGGLFSGGAGAADLGAAAALPFLGI